MPHLLYQTDSHTQAGRRPTLRKSIYQHEYDALMASPPARHSMDWTETPDQPSRVRVARQVERAGLLAWEPCAEGDEGAVLVHLRADA